MALWKLWQIKRKPYDVRIVGAGHRVRDESLKGYVLPKVSAISKFYDLIAHVDDKAPAELYCGKTGSGKSTLMVWVIWQKTDPQECETFGRVQEKAVILSPKTWHDRRDYDFDLPNFRRIDMTQFLPSNVFENHHAFVGSILTALYSDLTARGMMSHSVRTQLYELVSEGGIKSWADFEDRIDKARKGRGNFDTTILNAIRGDIQFLKDVGKEGTLDIDWSNLQENYVLDFGVFEENDIAKVFYMEYFLREIFRHKTKNILAIDEVHRLLNKGETSILSKVLREGRTGIKLYLATQNFSDVPSENVQFGSIFLFETQNGEDYKSIADEFVKDYVKLLRGHRFIDATQEHQNQVIPIYELDPERLNQARDKVRQSQTEQQIENNFVQKESETKQDREVADKIERDNLKEKITSVLEKNCLYGYEIAKRVGLKSKEAVKVRQPLRELVRDGIIKEIQIRLRNKDVTYYYLSNDESSHDLMMEETEKAVIKAGWKIISKAKHGVSEPDFIIENSGMQIIVEVETGSKKSLGEFDLRVSNYDKPVLIVVPNEEQKTRYKYLPCANSGKAKVCLISEIEEVLKNWD